MIDYISDNYFIIYGIIIAIAYPLWLIVVVPIIEKATGEYVDWTKMSDFFGVTVGYPISGAIVFLFWPIVLPVAVVAGLFLGVFYLNKFRLENKEKNSA